MAFSDCKFFQLIASSLIFIGDGPRQCGTLDSLVHIKPPFHGDIRAVAYSIV